MAVPSPEPVPPPSECINKNPCRREHFSTACLTAFSNLSWYFVPWSWYPVALKNYFDTQWCFHFLIVLLNRYLHKKNSNKLTNCFQIPGSSLLCNSAHTGDLKGLFLILLLHFLPCLLILPTEYDKKFIDAFIVKNCLIVLRYTSLPVL